MTDQLAASGPDLGKPAPKRQTLIVTDADEGRNQGDGCELKNPTNAGTCDDGRNVIAQSKPAQPATTQASAKSSARTDRPFVPSDCTTYGLGGYALLAELGHRMKDWKAYCNAQESQSATQAVVTDDGDRGGTWYCEDNVDGSGNYGTWEMTQHPERYYDCKRVD
ncbi:MAG: hypothetical protein K9G43_03140 [Rhodobacteraceae bacterium]|nr:hypothetical protein [Paracoccaceae bacterium]